MKFPDFYLTTYVGKCTELRVVHSLKPIKETYFAVPPVLGPVQMSQAPPALPTISQLFNYKSALKNLRVSAKSD